MKTVNDGPKLVPIPRWILCHNQSRHQSQNVVPNIFLIIEQKKYAHYRRKENLEESKECREEREYLLFHLH